MKPQLKIDKINIQYIKKQVSKKAVYNNSNYNTNFREDVLIEYMDYKIFADKMDLNFQKNIIKIFQNVRYIGTENKLTSDNIELNLITKEIDIFMDSKTDNVKIMQNQQFNLF